MDCRIDRALRTMFLRRKLRAIEAQRMKYPETNEGRRKYIQDSLKPRYQGIFYTLIFVGAIGLIITLLMCLNGNCSYLLAILFMLLFLVGIQGLERRPE
jgi:hypothetical protein